VFVLTINRDINEKPNSMKTPKFPVYEYIFTADITLVLTHLQQLHTVTVLGLLSATVKR
jgi:hypothetical protein